MSFILRGLGTAVPTTQLCPQDMQGLVAQYKPEMEKRIQPSWL